VAREDTNQLQGALWIESDSFFLQIVQEGWDAFTVVDINGNLLFASHSHERLAGFVPNHIDELTVRIDSEYRIDVHRLYARAAQTGETGKLEYRFRHKEDHWVWMESTAIPIYSSDGYFSHIAFVTNEITARKVYEKNLLALAYNDPLTGLPNRRLFKEHLNQALLQAKRSGRLLALLYLDVDDFKIINDTMGHDVGDHFLQEFAERIRGCLREVDMFARMGGDEFTILLPMIESEEEVETIARRILTSVQQPYYINGHQFSSTLSVGIALYPEHADDSISLLKQVDVAMYQVKGEGRNNFQFFRSEMVDKDELD
jgi:diguanylate cyclase (GGDEF)-like protein/PAS domain S-box-containing protein